MTDKLVFALPGNEVMADELATRLDAGAARLVTTNTVPHPSNAIEVSGLLADGVRRLSK